MHLTVYGCRLRGTPDTCTKLAGRSSAQSCHGTCSWSALVQGLCAMCSLSCPAWAWSIREHGKPREHRGAWGAASSWQVQTQTLSGLHPPPVKVHSLWPWAQLGHALNVQVSCADVQLPTMQTHAHHCRPPG